MLTMVSHLNMLSDPVKIDCEGRGQVPHCSVLDINLYSDDERTLFTPLLQCQKGNYWQIDQLCMRRG